jgi:hypothetical protein
VIASFLSVVNNPTELALQPINRGREPPGINEFVVGVKVEVGNRSLQQPDA